MKALSLFLSLVGLVTFSCKESVTEISTVSPFALTITVKDTLGAPVAGLRVAGGSLLSERSIMGLTLDWWANAVYVARITARDTANGAVLFRDSIPMVFADVDPSNPPAILGYTGGDGMLTLHDRYRFPGTFHLPEMIHTDNTGPDSIGTFTLRDTAVVVLLDTLSRRSMQVNARLLNGSNAVNVVWRPTPSAIPARPARPIASVYEKGASAHPAGTLAVTSTVFRVAAAAFVDFTITTLDGTTAQTPISRLMNGGTYMVTFSTIPFSSAPPGVSAPARISMITAPDWHLYQNYPNPFD